MEATIKTTNWDLNPINPKIDEVSEEIQDYVDSFDLGEDIAEVATQKPIKKMDKEVEKIILQFSKWYGNDPWIKATMNHDEILNVVNIYTPILSQQSIEFLSCGHTYGISAVSKDMLHLSIQLNFWR